MMRLAAKRKSREQGSALIEFTVCVVFFWLPLFAGLLVTGQNLLRAMQVTQVCRDAAHMFAFGTDFSASSYQSLLVNLAPALGLTTSAATSHGVIIISQIALLDDTCDGTSTPAAPVPCANSGHYVVVRRIVIGNPSLQASSLGTPASGLVAATTGIVSQRGYLNDPSTQASERGVSFAPPIVLPVTQDAFVAELYVTSPDSSGWSSIGPPTVGARFIF